MIIEKVINLYYDDTYKNFEAFICSGKWPFLWAELSLWSKFQK